MTFISRNSCNLSIHKMPRKCAAQFINCANSQIAPNIKLLRHLTEEFQVGIMSRDLILHAAVPVMRVSCYLLIFFHGYRDWPVCWYYESLYSKTLLLPNKAIPKLHTTYRVRFNH